MKSFFIDNQWSHQRDGKLSIGGLPLLSCRRNWEKEDRSVINNKIIVVIRCTLIYVCIFSLYSSRWLPLQVAGTWICGFSFLIPTSLSLWGHFGLDPSIGSCTILPDRHGRSSKEFLFVFAFLSPCLAIIVCYARYVGVLFLNKWVPGFVTRIFFIAHRAAQKSAAKKEEKNPIDEAKLLQVFLFHKFFSARVGVGESCRSCANSCITSAHGD